MRDSLSKLPPQKYPGFIDPRLFAVPAFNLCRSFNSELQDGIESPVLPVGDGDSGVLTVRFNPLLLTTNDYTLWIMFYFDGVLYCDYKGICPFFVSRKDNSQLIEEPTSSIRTNCYSLNMYL